MTACSTAGSMTEPAPPEHRGAPRLPPRVPSHRAAPVRKKSEWRDDWATSTWANWQPVRPNAPGTFDYVAQEMARAGVRLQPDQGSLIAGLRSQLKEYKARDKELKYTLRLEQQIAMLKADNARLKSESSQKYFDELKSENAYLNHKVINLGLALVKADKALESLQAEKHDLEQALKRLNVTQPASRVRGSVS